MSGDCLHEKGMLLLLPRHTLPEQFICLFLNPNELLLVPGLLPVLGYQILMSPGFPLCPLSLLVQPRLRGMLPSIHDPAP